MDMEFEESLISLEIRSIKNFIRTQRGLFYLNLLITVLNGYFIYIDRSLLNAGAFGALTFNCLWIGAQLFCLKQDLKLEKQRLANYEQIRDNENYKGALQQLENSKRAYDEAFVRNVPNIQLDKFRDTLGLGRTDIPGLTVVESQDT